MSSISLFHSYTSARIGDYYHRPYDGESIEYELIVH